MSRHPDSDANQQSRRPDAMTVTPHASAIPCSQKLIQIYQALSEINQTVIAQPDEQQLFSRVCEIAVDLAGTDLAWIGIVDHTSRCITPASSYGAGAEQLKPIPFSTQQSNANNCATTAAAYHNNHAVINNDCDPSPLTTPTHIQAGPRGWTSSASFPIQRAGQPFAVLSLYHQTDQFFDSVMIELFKKATHNISIALDNLDQQRAAYDTLETLRNNEQHFRAYFERSLFGMAASRPDRTLIEVNQALCEMLGYREEELINSKWDAQAHPEDLAANEVLFQQLIDGSIDEFMIEKRFFKKSGEVIDAHLAVRAVRNADASLACAVSLIEDITLRKMAERREKMRRHTLEKVARGYSLEAIMSQVIKSAEAIYPGSMCSILLTDQAGKQLLFGAAPSLPNFFNTAMHGIEIGMTAGSCAAAVYTGQRIIVEDIAAHPYWQNHKALAAQAALGSCWSEPIRAINGSVLGTFAIYHSEPSAPDEQKVALIESAAKQLAMTIERIRAQDELNLAASIYSNISEAILVSDTDHKIVAFNPAFSKMTGYTLADIQGKNAAILHAERHSSEFFKTMWDEVHQRGFWQGEIWNRRKNGETFLAWFTLNAIRNEHGAIQRYVAMGSDITGKVRSDELIWRQANYDFLTDLPNRYMFQDRLEQEIRKSVRQNALLALLFIDLDHFKDVNDSLGHAAGDQLLIQAAKRISGCVRETDTVARMGGDEFTVILPKLTSTLDGERMAERILAVLAEPYYIVDETIYIQASIGIAFCPNDTTEVDQLISNADQAMYASKTSGRNRLSYFTPALHDDACKRLQLLNDLRTALASRELELYFQPIVELASGRISKAEALLRWNHPEFGIIQPAEFIPLAEESGLIVEIGNWVFQDAAKKAKHWSELFKVPLQVSINMSLLQFQSSALSIPDWLAYLDALGLDAQQLNLEISEDVLLNTSEDVQKKLLQFCNTGIQLAIDDFGLGNSSLPSLARVAIDQLKIGRSFIQNIDTQHSSLVLCEAIIVMAHTLGLQVTGKGIETDGQRRALLESGCDHGQGYFFSHPLPAAEFAAFLAKTLDST